jgi:hypothetical protein
MTIWKLDQRPKRGGWAPGMYTCKCVYCSSEFIGDKRSVECADCAYDARSDRELVRRQCAEIANNVSLRVRSNEDLYNQGYNAAAREIADAILSMKDKP